MSADNFYRICRHPKGGYAAIMGFMSDREDGRPPRQPDERDHRFGTWQEAYQYADQDYTEYGIEIDSDILDDQNPNAYIMNARAELSALRSDVAGELGGNPNDCHLKAAFLTYIDAADLNLQKALA